MGKKDKRKSEVEVEDADDNEHGNEGNTEEKISWEEKIRYLNVISKPLASKKLTKKIYKTIKKGM